MDEIPVLVVSVEFPEDVADPGLLELIKELDRYFDSLESFSRRVRRSPAERYLALKRMRRACR